MTDPIADMLTRIRNALAIRKTEVVIPFSKIKYGIAKILEKEGFIHKVEKVKPSVKLKKRNFWQIKTILKYKENKEPMISSLKRISRPGRRIYVNSRQLPRVMNNLGIAIISTSVGLMTNKEARKRKLGGEILCEIW